MGNLPQLLCKDNAEPQSYGVSHSDWSGTDEWKDVNVCGLDLAATEQVLPSEQSWQSCLFKG